jgi:hypothetical protein
MFCLSYFIDKEAAGFGFQGLFMDFYISVIYCEGFLVTVRFEILTAVLLKVQVLRDFGLCHWVNGYRSVRGDRDACIVKGRRRSRAILRPLFARHEGTTILRNVGKYLRKDAA